jgi:pimeloyl-ACP methyl ester carboxylesterase
VKRALLFLALFAAGCLSYHQRPLGEGRPGVNIADIDGVGLRYQVHGQGPAVVMLHGFGSSLETWFRQVPLLARDHRVLVLDLKGFGFSARPPGDYSPREQARLVFGLMDKLGFDKAAVVAHSWGAAVALEMALLHPQRVQKLVLVSAWVFPEQVPVGLRWAQLPVLGEIIFGLFYAERPEEKMALAFYRPEKLPQQLVEMVEESMDWPGTRAAALAAVRGLDFERRLARHGEISQPVLLLWGRDDAVALVEFGLKLERQLPRARLVVFDECGHFPMFEAASAFDRELTAFLGGER